MGQAHTRFEHSTVILILLTLIAKLIVAWISIACNLYHHLLKSKILLFTVGEVKKHADPVR